MTSKVPEEKLAFSTHSYSPLFFLSCRSLILLSLLFLLHGCNYHADHPWDYTPCLPTQSWRPFGDEGIPISPSRLLNPYYCQQQEMPEGEVALPQILDLALVNSNATRETWAQARYSAATWGLSEAPLYPQWNAEIIAEAIRYSSFFGQQPLFIDEYVTYGPSLTLSCLIFDWGTQLSEAEGFRQTLWQSNWTHNREIQTVIQTTVVDYYTFLADREQVIASQANLADAGTVLESTEKKYRFGIADYSDILMAETLVARNENALLVTQQEEINSRLQVVADMGIPANTPVLIAGTMEINQLDPIEKNLDHYLVQAYVCRPDLFAANAHVKSKEAFVQAAIRDQYPSVHLDGSFGRSYYNRGEHDDYNYALEMSLDIPLFNGFEYRNRIRAARAELEKAWASMRQLEIDITQQVTQSFQDFMVAIDRVRVNREYVRVAEESYRASLAKYGAGTVDIVTVVNAQTDLADARYSLVKAKKDWFTNLIQLAYATGMMCS